MHAELLKWQELAFKNLVTFFTDYHILVLLLHLAVMCIMTFGAAEASIGSWSHKFLSAVVTHLTETQSSVITDDIKRRVILLHELHLPLVDSSSLHLTVARLATVLRGIAFGLKLLPTAFTLFFKSHRTIDINGLWTSVPNRVSVFSSHFSIILGT